MNTSTFSFLFKFTLLVELITQTKFTRKLVPFRWHVLLWVIIIRINISLLIILFAVVPMLTTPASSSVTSTLVKIALIIIRIILILIIRAFRPCKIRVRIHTLTTNSTSLALLWWMIKLTKSLCVFITILSKFTRLRLPSIHWVHYWTDSK